MDARRHRSRVDHDSRSGIPLLRFTTTKKCAFYDISMFVCCRRCGISGEFTSLPCVLPVAL